MVRLSDDDVRTIRASSESGKALGERYGVSQATISRIKRRQARADVKDLDMSGEHETEPAVEGAEIEPETPIMPAVEPESAETAECPEGTVKVRCTCANVHLGNGGKLSEGEVDCVPSDLADVLIEKGLAEAA